jgi:hypothetical protein
LSRHFSARERGSTIRSPFHARSCARSASGIRSMAAGEKWHASCRGCSPLAVGRIYTQPTPQVCPDVADFVAEFPQERPRFRSAASLDDCHCFVGSNGFRAGDLTLTPNMGRPEVAAGLRAWPICEGSALHQRRLTPSYGRHAPTPERTVGPARTSWIVDTQTRN